MVRQGFLQEESHVDAATSSKRCVAELKNEAKKNIAEKNEAIEKKNKKNDEIGQKNVRRIRVRRCVKDGCVEE